MMSNNGRAASETDPVALRHGTTSSRQTSRYSPQGARAQELSLNGLIRLRISGGDCAGLENSFAWASRSSLQSGAFLSCQPAHRADDRSDNVRVEQRE